MHTIPKEIVMLSLLCTPAAAFGFDTPATGDDESLCYSRAMIGFDSVINARLGVPAEHALGLALVSGPGGTQSQRIYSEAMLKTILSAYLWQDSPHSYAVNVFYHCAGDDTRLTKDQRDWLTLGH